MMISVFKGVRGSKYKSSQQLGVNIYGDRGASLIVTAEAAEQQQHISS